MKIKVIRSSQTVLFHSIKLVCKNNEVSPIRLGFFWVPGPGGGEVPASRFSKTIHGIRMKFGRVVENHKLINLV